MMRFSCLLSVLFLAQTLLSCNGGDNAGADGGSDLDTDTDSDSDTDTSTEWDNTGLCGKSGEAIVDAKGYVGTEDFYIVSDKGSGEDVCRVRFDLNSIGQPSIPCDDCEWVFVLERSNGTVITDVDGACADSELDLDSTSIEVLELVPVSYGYDDDYLGHAQVIMQLDETEGIWVAMEHADYDEETGAFSYDQQIGFCGY